MDFFIISAVSVVLILFYIEQNWTFSYSHYFIKAPINEPSFRIVHLSDLHNMRFGLNQKRLIKAVVKNKPDMIAFTGDLIQHWSDDIENALDLMRGLVQIAPVYYCLGNHEGRSKRTETLIKKLEALGVNVLINRQVRLPNGITISGLKDYTERAVKLPRIITLPQEALSLCKSERFTVVLSHRPEIFTQYVKAGAELVLCGHAHGGQVRLPNKRGFFTPDEGFFPEYTAGKLARDGTVMIVNRGLGYNIIPLRIFNRPEIGIIDLKKI